MITYTTSVVNMRYSIFYCILDGEKCKLYSLQVLDANNTCAYVRKCDFVAYCGEFIFMPERRDEYITISVEEYLDKLGCVFYSIEPEEAFQYMNMYNGV